jgi:hypothetical protein
MHIYDIRNNIFSLLDISDFLSFTATCTEYNENRFEIIASRSHLVSELFQKSLKINTPQDSENMLQELSLSLSEKKYGTEQLLERFKETTYTTALSKFILYTDSHIKLYLKVLTKFPTCTAIEIQDKSTFPNYTSYTSIISKCGSTLKELSGIGSTWYWVNAMCLKQLLDLAPNLEQLPLVSPYSLAIPDELCERNCLPSVRQLVLAFPIDTLLSKMKDIFPNLETLSITTNGMMTPEGWQKAKFPLQITHLKLEDVFLTTDVAHTLAAQCPLLTKETIIKEQEGWLFFEARSE